MIVVIQCAASKQPDAGHLETAAGTSVCFVADPAGAPTDSDVVYARPDDPSDTGPLWRDVLLQYNHKSRHNPLKLLPAWRLYDNRTYGRLVERMGIDNVYILSAGWGLISAAFLTPYYDITFSQAADAYKRRRHSHRYRDLQMLPEQTREPIVFFGGKDYLPLFATLTSSISTTKPSSTIPPRYRRCRDTYCGGSTQGLARTGNTSAPTPSSMEHFWMARRASFALLAG